MGDKKDNILVNIIIFLIIVFAFYYIVFMPDDWPVHSKMAAGALSQFFGDLAK